MDANLTRFHLLLGRRDWATFAHDDLEWDDARHELRLRAVPFVFKAAPRDDPPAQSDRRGAAADAFLNWYWIAESRDEIRARSSGDNQATHFWSAADAMPAPPPATAIFQPVEPPKIPRAKTFSGLAVTEDQHLVVGTLNPGGLLVFDLLGGGPPRAICWPAEIPFVPFDIVPRHGGGVWILDRDNGCFWGLDRNLSVLALDGAPITLTLAQEEVFQPDEGRRDPLPARTFPEPIALLHASPIVAENPVAIEALPDGSVVILDASAPSRVLRFAPAKTRAELPYFHLAQPKILNFPAYDFAFANGQLFIAAAGGNQAFAFEAGETLTPVNEYFPMRRFGGKALVAAGDQVFYDFGERWLPLVSQARPQFITEATLETRIFDSREPQSVWHRLMLDACLPPATDVEVWSRVAEEEDAVPLAVWEREPRLLRRDDGSELPYTPRPASPDRGTFELLLQKAHGRHLQIKLRLTGDGRVTPRLSALRIYYPRFSYLERYLPAVFRENAEPASFLDRFLANFEGFNTALEDRIAAVQMLFDVRSAPADSLAWLAGWFGVVLDPAWDETRRRLFIAHAMEFFQWRGTVRGLKTALRLALEEQPDAHIFDPPGAGCRCGDRFRIVEKFLARRTPRGESDEPVAHRFSVLLPVKSVTVTNRENLARQLALASRIVDLEKPAHTAFDVRFFWDHFRVGEARLGSDTVLGLGGRDPAIFPAPAVLGQSYLAESLIATGAPPSMPGRFITGRDRFPRPCPTTS